jgi:hypothetical protein
VKRQKARKQYQDDTAAQCIGRDPAEHATDQARVTVGWKR